MLKTIREVCSPDGDWKGIYIDGKLMIQGHTVRGYWKSLVFFGGGYEVLPPVEADIESLSKGMLPDRFADIPEEAYDVEG